MVWSQVCDPSCGSWFLDSSGARLRRPDALASGRTLSFFLAEDFFLGRLLGLGLVGSWTLVICAEILSRFLPSFGGTFLPLSWFSLGGSCRLVVQAPAIFLESYLGFFPLASSVC